MSGEIKEKGFSGFSKKNGAISENKTNSVSGINHIDVEIGQVFRLFVGVPPNPGSPGFIKKVQLITDSINFCFRSLKIERIKK